jgi:hypothetical protein
MKAYLARLVARAQSPAPPVVVAPRPASGPFEKNPFDQTASFAPRPAAPTAPPFALPITPPAPAREPIPADQPPATGTLAPSPAAKSVTKPSAALPITIPPPRRAPLANKIHQPHPDSFAAAFESPAFPEILTTRPGPGPAEKLSPRPEAPVPALSSDPASAAEEARLQRHADTFMARLSPRAESLLAALPPSSTSPDASSTGGAASPVTPRPLSVAPAPAPASPGPSVVIGRLSVEVVPPAAPVRPAPAARATPRRAASRPLPAPRSSARFGLGQL